MIIKEITIHNLCGIHMRPAGLVAKEIAKFPDVNFEIDNGTGFSNVKDMISLLVLDLSFGNTIWLKASGPNEEQACNTVSSILGQEFDFDKNLSNLLLRKCNAAIQSHNDIL